MFINNMTLDGFRNYSNETAQFVDGVNVIHGRNAQGKTNLIEAIFYLATGRAVRPASDKELINFNRENAVIRAEIMSAGRKQTLEARLFRGRRRVLLANDVNLKSASELSGRLAVVQFGPDDLNMVKDGAVVRRKLMDNCLSQLRPGYSAALIDFNKLYEHKTRILRDHFEKPSLLNLLDDFNQQLAEQNAKLIYYRAAFAEGLSRRATNIHKEFSDETENLTIKYKTVRDMPANEMKPNEILNELLEHQKEKYQAELRSGLCLSGSHKDDLIIEINDISARKFASQGQARTASISIKLAERDMHFDNLGEYPVLLLDDVLSELDSTRRDYVLSKIKSGQIFITGCDEKIVTNAKNSIMIRVENGKIDTTTKETME